MKSRLTIRRTPSRFPLWSWGLFPLALLIALAPALIRSQEVQLIPERRQLEVQRAAVALELARVELQIATRHNREVEQSVNSLPTVSDKMKRVMIETRTISPALLERLSSDVKLAEQHLTEVNRQSGANEQRELWRQADERQRIAALDLERTVEKEERGLATPLDVERARLGLELARIDAELVRDPTFLVDSMRAMQEKVYRLSQRIDELERRLDWVGDRVRVPFP